jgi:hypothetical protein
MSCGKSIIGLLIESALRMKTDIPSLYIASDMKIETFETFIYIHFDFSL